MDYSFLALCALICFVLHYLGRILYDKELARETCMNEIDAIGQHRREKKLGTVVVAGGSVAGLLVARACHDHFEKIVVIEAEAPLDPATKRARVPQNKALHALLAIVNVALDKWFPHLEESCQKLGLRILPAGVNNYVQGVPLKDANHPLHLAVAASRPGFERLIRTLVLGGQYPNIDYRQNNLVTAILSSQASPSRVQTVVVKSADGTITEIEPELVIDCTGPARQGLVWLKNAGFISDATIQPLLQSFDPKMRYATITVKIPEDIKSTLPIPGGFDNAGTILTCYGAELDSHVLFTMKIEDDRIYTGCGLYGAGELPKSIPELIEHARNMRNVQPLPEWFFDLLSKLSELGGTVDFVRSSPSSIVKYHLAKGLPSNFIAVGDAVMRVNPIYGQGCSKATLGAVVLDSVLSSCKSTIPPEFSKQFFDMQHTKTESIWSGTQVADYGQSTTTPSQGESLSKGSLIRWFAGNVQNAACQDHKIAEVFLSTRMMLKPSILLFAPSTLLRMIWVLANSPKVDGTL